MITACKLFTLYFPRQLQCCKYVIMFLYSICKKKRGSSEEFWGEGGEWGKHGRYNRESYILFRIFYWCSFFFLLLHFTFLSLLLLLIHSCFFVEFIHIFPTHTPPLALSLFLGKLWYGDCMQTKFLLCSYLTR